MINTWFSAATWTWVASGVILIGIGLAGMVLALPWMH